jgi:thiol:disulfide interchange protein
MPAGEWHEDEFYGKSEIYRQRLSVPVTVNQADKGATLTVTYQGARTPDSAIRRKRKSCRLAK